MGFAQNSRDGGAASRYGACSWKRIFVYSTVTSTACALLCILFATSVAQAQGVGSSAEIAGTVTDSSGAILPRVTINVIETQTGLKRTAVTNGTGQFRVVGLAPLVEGEIVDRRYKIVQIMPTGVRIQDEVNSGPPQLIPLSQG